jgi:hypothetical protein
MSAQNVGTGDRVARVVLGLAMLMLYFVLNGATRWVSLLGLVPLVTGLAGYCPMYSLVGFRTCTR